MTRPTSSSSFFSFARARTDCMALARSADSDFSLAGKVGFSVSQSGPIEFDDFPTVITVSLCVGSAVVVSMSEDTNSVSAYEWIAGSECSLTSNKNGVMSLHYVSGSHKPCLWLLANFKNKTQTTTINFTKTKFPPSLLTKVSRSTTNCW